MIHRPEEREAEVQVDTQEARAEFLSQFLLRHDLFLGRCHTAQPKEEPEACREAEQ
jgi:hypothetical protein